MRKRQASGRHLRHIELLDARDVSAMLKVKRSTVYAWTTTGQLPAIRLNGRLRFEREKVLALIGKA